MTTSMNNIDKTGVMTGDIDICPDFSRYAMFCNSTGNQTINLLPLLQLRCRQVVILSTQFTEGGATQRLVDLLKKNGIKYDVTKINEREEKKLDELTDKLFLLAQGYPEILWNIAGGQKIPSAALLCAFKKRITAGFEHDIVVYTEAVPPEIWYFGADYENHKMKTSAFISLKDLLYLSNFETMNDESRIYPDPEPEVKRKIETGKKAFKYFRDNELFREAFFNYMKPAKPDVRTPADIIKLIKESLNEVKPPFSKLHPIQDGYKNLEQNIVKLFSRLGQVKNREDLGKLIAPLKLIEKPAEIYDDYWNSIKKAAIDRVLNKIEFEEFKLVDANISIQQAGELISQIKDIGGVSNYEAGYLYKKHIPVFSNGTLFEWMVAAAILEEIDKDEELKSSVSEIYHSVKTRKLKSTEKPDAEHDLVIATKFGTLIIIELKTFEFSGKLAQAQEGMAYKKSGPYGKAMIIGPLFSNMGKTGKNGKKEYPSYIDEHTQKQVDTARQNGIEYYYLDQINDMLKNKLLK